MGIVTTTAYPSRYANDPNLWESETQKQPEQGEWRADQQCDTGCFFLDLDILKNGKAWPNLSFRQRELAWKIGDMLNAKPIFDRKARNYCAGMWHITGTNLTTDPFEMEEVGDVLDVLDRLKEAGYEPDGMIYIHFSPAHYDARMIMNLCNIMEARNELLVQALDLTEPLRIVVNETLAFGIQLNAFSFEVLEACIYLLQQASFQATAVGRARMKPCDRQNPKFQMRSWLLRLGFIGEEFAGPRRTLLRKLEGDGAFFDDLGKEKAAKRRKAKRMIG